VNIITVIFFFMWIVFNGRFTVETVVTGVLLSAGIYWFSCRFLGFRAGSDAVIVRKLHRGVFYALVLVRETVKANWEITKVVFARKIVVEPQILYFKTQLKSEVLRVVLANSITLTPGTLTVALSGNEYCIHCLTKEMAADVEFSEFEKLLMAFEKQRSGVLRDIIKNHRRGQSR